MPDSFVGRMKERLERLGRGKPLLIEQLHDAANFGSAQAVFELGELRLRFLNDRGFETVDIEIPDGNGGIAVVPLENLAVAVNWVSLKDLLHHYQLSDSIADSRLESAPHPGPFLTLDGALGLLGQGWDQVVEACGNADLIRRASDIQGFIQKRMADSFSISADRFAAAHEPEADAGGSGPAP